MSTTTPAIHMHKRIEIAREAAGRTREEVAAVIGVTEKTIYRWEINKAAPSLIDGLRLAEYLDIDPAWLVEEGRGPVAQSSVRADPRCGTASRRPFRPVNAP